MSRRQSFVGSLIQAQLDAERLKAARIRAQTLAAREAERAQKAYEQAQRATEKERARLHVESRLAAASARNEQIEHEVACLESLLEGVLRRIVRTLRGTEESSPVAGLRSWSAGG